MALVVCVSVFGITEAELDSICRQFELQEVVVESQRGNKAESTLPVQRMDGDQLEQLSSHSVADALRYFSGVQIKDFGGIGGMKTVDVRSMGTHHLGVFYDGIEIGNAQNGTVDLGKFSLENIEEIALYNGQKTEILQPAKDFGSAGTLYIRTRRPTFDQGRNYHVVATMKAGTFGLANPSLLYEQKLTETIHLSLNGEYTYATGRYHFLDKTNDTINIRQNGDVQAFRAEVGLFGYLRQGKWHLKGYFYDSEKGIPRAIIRNQWTSAQRQWDRNAFVQGSYTQTWSIYSLLVNAKYSNDYMRYRNNDTTMAFVDNRFWQQEVYVSVANKWQVFRWWDLGLSGDYIWNKLDANLLNFVNPQRHTGLVSAVTAWHYKWIKAQVSCLGTFVQDNIRQSTKLSKPRFTPMVSLSYQPWLREQLYLHGFYKQVYRMPTFNDLYYTEVGSANLQPEEAVQYDGGIEYSKTTSPTSTTTIGVTLKADGYFNQIKNKIVAIPRGNSQYRWQMMNLGYVEIRGVDVNTQLHLQYREFGFQLGGAYTYQKAQDFTNPQDELTYGGQIAYVPWNNASATAAVTWRGWSLNYAFSYVGTRYSASANILANQVGAWDTHDLSLSKTWTLPVGRLNTSIEINNLSNTQYEIIRNYPMPGLNGKLIVKYSL